MFYYISSILLLGLNYLWYDMMVLRAACWNRGLRLCSNHFFIRTVKIGFYFNCSYEQVWNWLVPKYILLNHNVSLLQTLIIWAFEHPAKPKWILTSQSFFMFWCDSLNGSLLEQGLVQSLKLIEDCLNVLLYVMDLITRINLSMFWCDCVKGSLLKQRLAPLFQPIFYKDSWNRFLFQISFIQV